MKRLFSRPLFRAAAGISLAGLTIGYLLLLPMSDKFVRYLIWRLTSSAPALRGSVKNGDARIHFVSYGSGPAVVLLHGGLSNRLSWFSQVPWLVASGRRVVLLDTRGHGRSGLGKTELSYRLLAADAIEVMDQLNIEQADVIGWSDGGNTALMLGLYWPQRVRRLVAISANFSPSGLTATLTGVVSEPSTGVTYWMKRWWTGAGDRLAELETRVKRMWRTRPQLQPVDLSKIEAPTLVIIGAKDIVSVPHAEKMVDMLPHGSLAIVPGGHSTPVTHSQQVNRLVGRFFDFAPSD